MFGCVNVLAGPGAIGSGGDDVSGLVCAGAFLALPDGTLLGVQRSRTLLPLVQLDPATNLVTPYCHGEAHLQPGASSGPVPVGAMCLLANGSLLVTSVYPGRVWRVERETGLLSVFAGSGEEGDHLDSSAPATQLSQPQGLAELPDGSVLIADTGNHRILRVDPGGTVTRYPSPGAGGAGHGDLHLVQPKSLLRLQDGTLLIADTGNRRVIGVALDGSITVRFDAASLVDGQDHSDYRVRPFNPTHLALLPDGSPQGSVLVTDSLNGQIFRVHPDGHITLFAGRGARASGPRRNVGSRIEVQDPTATELRVPTGVVVLPDHRVLINDFGNSRILAISPPDHLQGILENLVQLGVAAAAKGDDRTVAEVAAEFDHLQDPAPSAWASGPELARMPKVLLELVQEYLVLTPLERARVRQASAILERQLRLRSPEGATEGKQEAPPRDPAGRKRGPGDREASDRDPKQLRETPRK